MRFELCQLSLDVEDCLFEDLDFYLHQILLFSIHYLLLHEYIEHKVLFHLQSLMFYPMRIHNL